MLAARNVLRGISTMDHKYWTYIVASLSGTLHIRMTKYRALHVGGQKWGVNQIMLTPAVEKFLNPRAIEAAAGSFDSVRLLPHSAQDDIP